VANTAADPDSGSAAVQCWERRCAEQVAETNCPCPEHLGLETLAEVSVVCPGVRQESGLCARRLMSSSLPVALCHYRHSLAVGEMLLFSHLDMDTGMDSGRVRRWVEVLGLAAAIARPGKGGRAWGTLAVAEQDSASL
jgi:hypothetical protein